MAKLKGSLCLRQLFLNLLLLRLFLPLMVVSLIAIAGLAYLGEQKLLNRQNQIVQSMSQIVDTHLEHGGRVLDAVARVAETSERSNLPTFMESTWGAYGYFETIYCLNEKNKITLMMPSDPRYIGLDMSNLPDLKKGGEESCLIISRPFISLRTGRPTVYLVRYLSNEGCIIGELNLNLFQQEITDMISRSERDFVFIMDQAGTLIAHQSLDLVKQQINLSNLKIFKNMLVGKPNAFYKYNGSMVVGSAVRVEKTGWVVVDQISVAVFLRSYAVAFGIILLASLIIWITLVYNLRNQLQRNVIKPLEQLSEGVNALARGNFDQASFLSPIPATFTELNKLSADFQFMSNSLHAREIERKLHENKIKAQRHLLFNAEKERRESLEKALIMKDEFITLISHEFKTPLNVIYSAIQLIESVYFKQIPDRVKELIGNIKQNTFRQLRLADNLLDVTRLKSGQFKLNMKNIDIVYLTDVIAESVELYAIQKNIKISFESDITSKTISIDDEKYERIMLNLLSNAIKFTEKDGCITVTLKENAQNNLLEIKVTDTGIGIPKDKQDLIFERFGQVDSNLSRQAEGTGIGLSLVKLLVNILGGTIAVESELGKGSTFIIMLPAKEEIIDDEVAASLDVEDRLVREIKVQFSDIYF